MLSDVRFMFEDVHKGEGLQAESRELEMGV